MSRRPTPLQQEFAALRHHVREANKHARVSQDRFGFRAQHNAPLDQIDTSSVGGPPRLAMAAEDIR